MIGREFEDPMDEIYAIRRDISRVCDYDVDKLMARARARMEKDVATGRRQYVRLPIVCHVARISAEGH